MDVYSILRHPREHYNEQARIERFKIFELLFGFKMEGETSSVQYTLKMYEYIEGLNQSGYWMEFELSVDLIMVSLTDGLAQFVLDYRMNNIVPTILELINLIEIAEFSLRKEKKHVMLVDSFGSKKSFKNKKGSKSTQVDGGVVEKKAKETEPKGTCFH